jgi:hypothetical protein
MFYLFTFLTFFIILLFPFILLALPLIKSIIVLPWRLRLRVLESYYKSLVLYHIRLQPGIIVVKSRDYNRIAGRRIGSVAISTFSFVRTRKSKS